MAGLASLFAALLIALSLQRRLWDKPESDEPLSVQLALLLLLVALPVTICIITIAAIEGDTELTHWENVIVGGTLSWSLLWLVSPALAPRIHLLGSTLEARVPERFRHAAAVLWHLMPLILAVGIGIPLAVFAE